MFSKPVLIFCAFLFSLLQCPMVLQGACVEDLIPKQGRVEVGFGTLFYEEMGEGEPVILIHDHPLNLCMWDEQFHEFAKHFRVIRYDLRGYGSSSTQAEYIQFTHAEDLVKLMFALEIDSAHIVGLSLGANIAADMLAWHPEKVKSVVMVSGSVSQQPGPSQPMDAEESARRDSAIAGIQEQDIHSLKLELFKTLMQSAGSQRERIREPLWQMFEGWNAWQLLHKEARIIGGRDTYNEIIRTRPDIPVLMVEGRLLADTFQETTEIMPYLPRSKKVVMDDCGHLPNMEQPGAFNEIVLRFLF